MKVILTSRLLELLHMDLFSPIRITNLSGKLYAFVIVDDYSHYKWVLFLVHKNETHKVFVKYCRRIQNEKGFTRGKLETTLFLMFDGNDMLLCKSILMILYLVLLMKTCAKNSLRLCRMNSK